MAQQTNGKLSIYTMTLVVSQQSWSQLQIIICFGICSFSCQGHRVPSTYGQEKHHRNTYWFTKLTELVCELLCDIRYTCICTLSLPHPGVWVEAPPALVVTLVLLLLVRLLAPLGPLGLLLLPPLRVRGRLRSGGACGRRRRRRGVHVEGQVRVVQLRLGLVVVVRGPLPVTVAQLALPVPVTDVSVSVPVPLAVAAFVASSAVAVTAVVGASPSERAVVVSTATPVAVPCLSPLHVSLSLSVSVPVTVSISPVVSRVLFVVGAWEECTQDCLLTISLILPFPIFSFWLKVN